MSLERKKAEFYEYNINKHNTDKLKIIQILTNNEFEGFKETDILQYQFAIDAYFKANEKTIQERIDENSKTVGDWKKTIFPEKQNYPCPIKGCTGKKTIYHGADYWKCSAGGKAHWHCWRVAGIWLRWHPGSEITQEEKAAEFAGYPKEIHDRKPVDTL